MTRLVNQLVVCGTLASAMGCAKKPAADVTPTVDVPVVPASASPVVVASGRTAPSQPVPRAFPGATKDPSGGVFGLDDARRGGLEGVDRLMATIETSEGDLTCELFPDKAPKTVANFVGLARGVRPWKGPEGWVNGPYYDGTTFHRVIDGFMIQGGDLKGDGTGEPGYTFADEVWPGAKHDRAGLLCMANRGPNTNGAQFFIMDAPASHLDASYTIFGMCTPESVVHAIAKVPKDSRDRPLTPVVIRHVVIAPEP